MPNVTIPNYATAGSGDHFGAVWKLTRALKKAGWTYKASSSGSSKDATGVAGNDKWGGAIDPLTDAIPSLANGAWWCAQGPSVLKIPITSAIAGSFIRGENVIQGTTGAEGEVLGAVFDTGSSTGWIVIAPRVAGSGADPQGWDHTHAVTGALSAASFTPSAAVIEYATQIVFWRGSDLTVGTWYFQTVDRVGEAASQFSTLVGAAGCTNTVAPGGGGTGNAFPTVGSWVPLGTGGSAGHKEWPGTTSGGPGNPIAIGKTQIMVANCTPATNVSADGSFILALGNPGVNAGSYTGFSLQRLDDQEEGDVCPFVTWHPCTTGATVAVADASGTTTNNDLSTWAPGIGGGMGRSSSVTLGAAWLRSWRRRGLSGESFVPLEGASLAVFGAGGSLPNTLVNIIVTDGEKVASEETVSFVAEPVWVGCFQNLFKTRKGTLRWLLLVPSGNGNDTYSAKSYVQLANFGTPGFALIGGPWDGTSTPVNA
jgi:hypothetical protein